MGVRPQQSGPPGQTMTKKGLCALSGVSYCLLKTIPVVLQSQPLSCITDKAINLPSGIFWKLCVVNLLAGVGTRV